MNRVMKQVLIGSTFAFGLALSPAMAQHDHGAHEQGEEAGHSHEKAAAHGGAVTMSKEFHVETVVMPDQVRLYLCDGSQNPMHVKHWEKGLVEATGVVNFRERGRGTTPTFTFANYQCLGCPMLESEGNRIGPELTHVGARLKAGYLVAFPGPSARQLRQPPPRSVAAHWCSAPESAPGADDLTPAHAQVIFLRRRTEALKDWEERAWKLNSRFLALSTELDAMAEELDEAKRHGRGLEDAPLRKGCLHG